MIFLNLFEIDFVMKNYVFFKYGVIEDETIKLNRSKRIYHLKNDVF